ncbi:MAG: hypothetical protein FWD23_02510 [Oscillospiraceae bacterium]|nr:hypothetical protein [Oscillospiraceae bacterium]
MKKYLVDVYLPAVGAHYDVYLPAGKRVGEAVSLLAGIMESLSGGGFKSRADPVFLDADGGEPIDYGISVYDAGIRNASRLILI